MWMKTNSAGFYGASKHSIMLALICEYIITAAIYRLIPLKLIKTDKGFSDQNLWQPLVKRMLTVNTESVAATWASGRGISGFGLSSEWSSALREVLVTADVFYPLCLREPQPHLQQLGGIRLSPTQRCPGLEPCGGRGQFLNHARINYVQKVGLLWHCCQGWAVTPWTLRIGCRLCVWFSMRYFHKCTLSKREAQEKLH